MGEPFLTPERLARNRLGESLEQTEERKQAIHESGVKLGGTPGAAPYRPRVLYGKRKVFWPRGDAAAARIYRILQGCAKSTSLEQAVEGAEYKRLAKEYAEIWIYYQTRARPAPIKGNDHNPFRYLSDVDAERMFIAKVEAICDRSTGKLGSWWAK